MKRVMIVATTTALALGSIVCVLAVENGEEAQLRAADVPPAVMQALRERSSGAVLPSHVRFARDETSRDVRTVPAGVREDVAKWIGKVVREQWLPEDMIEKMTGEIRWMETVAPPPHDEDFVRLEYTRSKDEAFCFVEGFSNLAILWRNNGIEPGDDAEAAATELAERLLRIPDERVSDLSADLTAVHAGEARLYVGYLRIPKQTRWPNWYTSMPVWITPGYFCVVVVPDRTGERPAEWQGKPRLPEARF